MDHVEIIANCIEENAGFPMVLAEAQHKAEQIIAALTKAGCSIIGPEPVTVVTGDGKWHCEIYSYQHVECTHIDEMRPEVEQGP